MAETYEPYGSYSSIPDTDYSKNNLLADGSNWMTGGLASGVAGDLISFSGDLFGTNQAREAAAAQEAASIRAADLQKEHANRLWTDSEGLRSLRDSSLGQVNRIMAGDRSSFYNSPEYNQVLGAGQGTVYNKLNSQMGQNRLSSMMGKAGESALGEFDNFYGRIAQTAGITSEGLNTSNSQIQQATDAQVALRQDAADAAASGLVGASNQQKGGIVGMIGGIFSDSRLKENIRLIGSDASINWYRWDWTDEAKGLVGDQSNVGVIAQEVQQTHPEAVTEHPSGYLIVDYGRLN